MRAADFALLVLICAVGALSNVLSKIVVDQWAVPPLFFAAARFALVAVIMLPWLLPMPRPRWRIILISLLMGGGNFALLFIALQTASPSAVAIVLQAGVPITVLLSVVMLGERLEWRRTLGSALTMAGVLILLWGPGALNYSGGLWFAIASTFAAALGIIVMKQVEDVSPFRFQAWVGLVSALSLSLGTVLLEQGQWQASADAGWPFLAVLAFTAIAVSIGAHSAYFHLIGRYEANLIAPLTLMLPLMTIALGVIMTGDVIDLGLATGTALAIAGVLLVAARRNRVQTLPPVPEL